MDHIGNYREAAMVKTRKVYHGDRSVDCLPRIAAGQTIISTGGTPIADFTVPTFSNPPTDAELQNMIATLGVIFGNRDEHAPQWLVSGTNAAANSVTRDTSGGWLLTTAGAPNDQVIVGPRAARRLEVGYLTTLRPRWEWVIRTPADSVAAMIIKCGLQLTGALDFATDNDQYAMRYQDTVNGGRWQAGVTVAGAPTVRDTGVPVGLDRIYRLIADVGFNLAGQLIAKFYIADNDASEGAEIGDERRVSSGINVPLQTTEFPALTPGVVLFPYIAIEQTGQAPVSLAVIDHRFSEFGILKVPDEGGGPVE